MTIERTFFDNGCTIYTKVTGTLTKEEFEQDFFQLLNSTEQIKQSSINHIYDLSEAADIALDEEDIQRLTQLGITYGLGEKRIRTAIVAVDSHAIELARLHQNLSTLLGLKEVEIFDTVEKAAKWLGTQIPALEDNTKTA